MEDIKSNSSRHEKNDSTHCRGCSEDGRIGAEGDCVEEVLIKSNAPRKHAAIEMKKNEGQRDATFGRCATRG